ncbi:GntR family transcriptional regulator [Timonella sp. A28]|uniref:GntR family transcriptional regulator n=1 Tax=Timonella sp. A28 TaxID=3442640 RepID=UPI003EBA429E
MDQSLGSVHQTLSQSVYAELRRRIVERRYEPGDRLVERVLADEMDVSRVPVREALRELVRDGLVDVAPRKGMFVRRVSREDLVELVEIRSALDVLLFKRLALKLDEVSVGRFRALFADTELAIEQGRMADAVLLNGQFHALAQSCASSDTLQQIMHTVEARMSWLLTQHTDVSHMFAEHRGLFDAMVAQDFVLLERLVQEHVESSWRSAVGLNPDLA